MAVTRGYKGLQMLEWVASSYKGVTRGKSGLQRVTRAYRG